jgi:hypothetical protein
LSGGTEGGDAISYELQIPRINAEKLTGLLAAVR